jgi:deaminated glutathione amidase
MKVAAIQMTSGPDVPANLEDSRALLEAAALQGARLAALPENFSFMGLKDSDKRAVAEADGHGPVQDFLAASARRLRLWIVAGTVPLAAGADGRVAAACLVYDGDGERVARYDKIHLFDVDIPGRNESYRESAHVAPGAVVTVVDTPAGRLGLSVCYDVRFPELYRQLSAAGAELFTVPSAFTGPTGRAQWETLLRARAIENQAFVVAANQVGEHPAGHRSGGRSMIIDPWGLILAQAPDRVAHVVADLDLDRQREIRVSLPALANRRPSAYRWPALEAV